MGLEIPDGISFLRNWLAIAVAKYFYWREAGCNQRRPNLELIFLGGNWLKRINFEEDWFEFRKCKFGRCLRDRHYIAPK